MYFVFAKGEDFPSITCLEEMGIWDVQNSSSGLFALQDFDSEDRFRG